MDAAVPLPNISVTDPEQVAEDIASAVDCIPFYIHHLINQFRDVEGEINQEDIALTVQECLRNPLNLWKMDNYRCVHDNDPSSKGSRDYADI